MNVSEKNARGKFNALVARTLDASDEPPCVEAENWGLVLDGAFTLKEIEAIAAAYREYLQTSGKPT